jgi:hypothetical protein
VFYSHFRRGDKKDVCPKWMKIALCPATALPGSVALRFVIPRAVEGSAVPRTFPGNVFRQSKPALQEVVRPALTSVDEIGVAAMRFSDREPDEKEVKDGTTTYQL